MKKNLIVWGIVVLLASTSFAGVVKKSKLDVTFKGFGRFMSAQNEKLTTLQKWTDSKSEFKGQGLLGGLAGKTILRSGDTGEIVDLPGLSVFRLDHKKKEYSATPIQKLAEEVHGEEPEEAEKVESHIKIIRSEFKVEDTGESSVINNFPTRKYSVHWLTEWENTETGEKGTTQLTTLVWTTPETDTLQKAQEEEMNFSRAYWEKIGLETSDISQEILGTSWLSLLSSMSPGSGGISEDVSKFASEMKKIKGYPVVIDGKYYKTSQKSEAEPEQKEAKSVRGVLGGLAKKVIKKKSSEEGSQEPSLTYRIELIELQLADLSAGDFQIPANYKKKS